jgi:hypothetical protein
MLSCLTLKIMMVTEQKITTNEVEWIKSGSLNFAAFLSLFFQGGLSDSLNSSGKS